MTSTPSRSTVATDQLAVGAGDFHGLGEAESAGPEAEAGLDFGHDQNEE
jgi:hypothetical protein